MNLNFLIQTAKNENIPVGEFVTRFIDLSQVTSLVNRRFYRQGLNWAVSNFQIQSPFKCGVAIQKLPNTWVMSNAWEKGFRAWQKMNAEALAEAPSVKPKFLDFKIFADQFHAADGFKDNLLPSSLVYDESNQTVTRNVITPGEWESSKLRIPNTSLPAQTVDLEIIAVGGSYPGTGESGLESVSLIEGYASSRGLPNVLDPNAPADAAD